MPSWKSLPSRLRLTHSRHQGVVPRSLSQSSHLPNGKGCYCHHGQDVIGHVRSKNVLLGLPKNVTIRAPFTVSFFYKKNMCI